MTSKRQRDRPVPALLPTVVVALLLALVVLATPSTVTWELPRDIRPDLPPYPGEPALPPQEFEEQPRGGDTPAPIDDGLPELSPIWGQATWGILFFLLIAAAVLLAWLYIRYRRSRTPDEDRDDLQVGTEIAPEAQIPVMTRAAARAQHELRAGTDRGDAIIKAWLMLEDAAADSGMRRRPSDTPTDLTLTVLNRTQADRDATHGLLALYHRARFGTAPMTPDDQERAITYLEVLARSWDRVRP